MNDQFTKEDFSQALKEVRAKGNQRIKQKGLNHLTSDFEILGVLYQELYEYNEAIHDRLSEEDKKEELLDIAYAALLGVMRKNALSKENKVDKR